MEGSEGIASAQVQLSGVVPAWATAPGPGPF